MEQLIEQIYDELYRLSIVKALEGLGLQANIFISPLGGRRGGIDCASMRLLPKVPKIKDIENLYR